MKVWDRAGTKLATPASAVRRVTDCANGLKPLINGGFIYSFSVVCIHFASSVIDLLQSHGRRCQRHNFMSITWWLNVWMWFKPEVRSYLSITHPILPLYVGNTIISTRCTLDSLPNSESAKSKIKIQQSPKMACSTYRRKCFHLLMTDTLVYFSGYYIKRCACVPYTYPPSPVPKSRLLQIRRTIHV